jgi:nucleotide-binding universal stress UspA family protein
VVSADGGSFLSISTLAISSGSPVLTVDPREGPSAGETIRDQTGALGADLVVMGSYGRSRLQEVILGGAGREMSKHGAMPLLTNR